MKNLQKIAFFLIAALSFNLCNADTFSQEVKHVQGLLKPLVDSKSLSPEDALAQARTIAILNRLNNACKNKKLSRAYVKYAKTIQDNPLHSNLLDHPEQYTTYGLCDCAFLKKELTRLKWARIAEQAKKGFASAKKIIKRVAAPLIGIAGAAALYVASKGQSDVTAPQANCSALTPLSPYTHTTHPFMPPQFGQQPIITEVRAMVQHHIGEEEMCIRLGSVCGTYPDYPTLYPDLNITTPTQSTNASLLLPDFNDTHTQDSPVITTHVPSRPTSTALVSVPQSTPLPTCAPHEQPLLCPSGASSTGQCRTDAINARKKLEREIIKNLATSPKTSDEKLNPQPTPTANTCTPSEIMNEPDTCPVEQKAGTSTPRSTQPKQQQKRPISIIARNFIINILIINGSPAIVRYVKNKRGPALKFTINNIKESLKINIEAGDCSLMTLYKLPVKITISNDDNLPNLVPLNMLDQPDLMVESKACNRIRSFFGMCLAGVTTLIVIQAKYLINKPIKEITEFDILIVGSIGITALTVPLFIGANESLLLSKKIFGNLLKPKEKKIIDGYIRIKDGSLV